MQELASKALLAVKHSTDTHWVGDGFPVRTLFSYQTLGERLSPFLLLDHAGPTEFPPTDKRLGVGAHPHRGFETVTIVYRGQVEHRDSSGGGGTIGPGDVQWMTAAAGVVHEEFHGADFAGRGGTFEMVQLWVNLPAKDKLSPPRYQSIPSSAIPNVPLPNDGGTARLIAGQLAGVQGPAKTFTPMNVWDLNLTTGEPLTLELHEGHSTALVVLRGSIRVNGSSRVETAELAILGQEGKVVQVDEANGAAVLLLSGAPIKEPIVGQGPFVMNTQQEISQAISDYRNGKMGRLL